MLRFREPSQITAHTLACIAWEIAHAFYKNPEVIVSEVKTGLPGEFLGILDRWQHANSALVI